MMRTGRARHPCQRFHGTFLKQRRDRTPLGTDLPQVELGCTFASNHHEIHAVRQ